MIIRSSFVGDDPGRTRHLLDAENNELVVERTDLDRGCPADLDLMLQMCSALKASNPRASISVGHFKCSPQFKLNGDAGLQRLIEVVEREHGIPADQPRKVVVHKKGRRVAHVHLLYAAVNPRTGRVLSSKLNYQADELASRILEMEFGEPIVPGPRLKKNYEALIERGELAMAAVLSQYEPVRNRGRDPENERQQGSRTKMPLMEFRRRLSNALAASGSPPSLPRALDNGEFAIAIGDRRDVVMVVHLKTGTPYSLARVIKGMSRPVILTEAEQASFRARARPVADVVRDGLSLSYRIGEARVASHIRRGLFEAAIDGEGAPFLSKLRDQRAAQRGQISGGMTLKAYRSGIRANDQLAKELIQRRIDRAFRTARLLELPAARKAAFALAGAGAILAGASFALSIGAGFLATMMLRDQAKARRAEAAVLIAARKRSDNAAITDTRPAVNYDLAEGRQEPIKRRPAPTFDFDQIPREHRVLAGIVMHHMSHDWRTDVTEAAERALGLEVVDGLRTLHKVGSDKQKAMIANWARGVKNTYAAAAALRKAGECDAASSLERRDRHLAARAPTLTLERG